MDYFSLDKAGLKLMTSFLILSVRRQFYQNMFAPEPHSTREDPFAVICTSTKEEARGGKGSSLATIEIRARVLKI